MADLNDLNLKRLAEKPIEFVLLHPATGDELDHEGEKFTLSIYTRDSSIYKAADIAEARLQADKKIKNTVDKAIESQDGYIRVMAECIESGRIFENGEWVDISKANALEYLNKYDWIADQARVVLFDRSRLLENAKKKQ